jgi:hypothetical protein
MKCIDAIEGITKAILFRLHSVKVEDRLDDSEYIRNVKAVIDGTAGFLNSNPEIVDEPQILLNVLYDYSRSLWLKNQSGLEITSDTAQSRTLLESNEEYETYYYDYLYHRGLYPR